jgi:hypothetical protein
MRESPLLRDIVIANCKPPDGTFQINDPVMFIENVPASMFDLAAST